MRKLGKSILTTFGLSMIMIGGSVLGVRAQFCASTETIQPISPTIKVRDFYYRLYRPSGGANMATVRSELRCLKFLAPNPVPGQPGMWVLGSLAVLSSATELSAVANAFQQRGFDLRDIWIAGSRRDYDRRCTRDWYNGSVAITYSNWAPGEPNNPDHPTSPDDCSYPFFETQRFLKTGTGLMGNLKPSSLRGASNLPMGYLVRFSQAGIIMF